MTTRFIILTITVSICLTKSFVICGQTSNSRPIDNKILLQSNGLKYDTSKTAIIQFNSKSIWPFDSTFKTATLTQDELQNVDSILIACVANYNISLDKDRKAWGIDLNKRNYRKQLIVAANKDGQKEVWVNCFCEIYDENWKTKPFGIEDGGNCYFNFIINLSTKDYFNLSVNGLG